jgi:hypothetical protein
MGADAPPNWGSGIDRAVVPFRYAASHHLPLCNRSIPDEQAARTDVYAFAPPIWRRIRGMGAKADEIRKQAQECRQLARHGSQGGR